jgi:hypothetical protein
MLSLAKKPVIVFTKIDAAELAKDARISRHQKVPYACSPISLRQADGYPQ